MRKLQTLSSVIILGSAIIASWASTAHAESPEDRIITYSFREDPQDPESDVVFEMMVKLTALDGEASSVGWMIETIEYFQIDENGDPIAMWGVSYPELDTPDGLWWVAHGDTLNPLPQEFATPPTLDGTATAANQSDPDLNYFVQSGSCSGGCSAMFGGSVGAISFGFQVAGESEPVDEGDDEPVEVGEIGPPQ